MVTKFNGKVYFCGKERKFKRCPNKTLKNYQKSVEDYQNKLYPLAEGNRDFQFQMDEILEEIAVIDNNMDLLAKLESPTDKEIRDSIKLNKEKLKLQKEAHKLRVEKDKTDLENRKLYDELNIKLEKTYDKFAMAIFDKWEEGTFQEYADSADYDIAPHLHYLYRLSLAGVKQEELNDAYKKILTESFQ